MEAEISLRTLCGNENHQVPDSKCKQPFEELEDRELFHLLTPEKEKVNERSQIFFNGRSRFSDFEGLCMDERAERSFADLEAYKRYCLHSNIPISLKPSKERIKFDTAIYIKA